MTGRVKGVRDGIGHRSELERGHEPVLRRNENKSYLGKRQSLPELLVREADQVVDVGPAERSRPDVDAHAAGRRVVGVDVEATLVKRLASDE